MNIKTVKPHHLEEFRSKNKVISVEKEHNISAIPESYEVKS